ncbi:aminoglycoside phosphotransferase family protein [Tenacibaculum sp. 190524A02b]|uniref:N-acetylhexosamine 1-kinase n=1 Tax=Tenacibaculum vairaonense TaxID=3137860 RepID=A0ABM9PJ51_9FLAO
MDNAAIQNICQAFQIQGNFSLVEVIQSGYINTTYKITTSTSSYILQKVNHQIFKDIEGLSSNIVRITKHLQSKTSPEKQHQALQVVFTHNEQAYYKHKDHTFWRMFNFIPNAITFETIQNEWQAETMGKAFANYHEQLSDLPQPPLIETLPDFHNTSLRIKHFKTAIQNNSHGRNKDTQKEIDYLLKLAPEMHAVVELGKQHKIPLRTIHQDAKLSNILFDNTNQAIAIIDLDTTMPGYLCYDFGDAVRTGMNTATEDEQNLDKISLHLEHFKAFTKGYAANSHHFITKEEINTLVLGVKVITYEQAIRFLTDYLQGDTYYKTSYSKHNLIRTRVQIAFLKNIIKYYDVLTNYVMEQYTVFS